MCAFPLAGGGREPLTLSRWLPRFLTVAKGKRKKNTGYQARAQHIVHIKFWVISPCVHLSYLSISGSMVGCSVVQCRLSCPLHLSNTVFCPTFQWKGFDNSLKNSFPHLPSYLVSSLLSCRLHSCYSLCLHFCLGPSGSHL